MKRCLLIIALGLMLSGCNSDDGGGNGNGSSGPVGFAGFVKDVLDNPANSEPVAINNKDFRFDDDPAAFDDVLNGD